MASLRQIRRRIRSVKNTKQITRAMQMVAASKLKRSQVRLMAARPYARKMDELLGHLAAAAGQIQNSLFDKREVKKIALVIISSDKGLAGSYNVNIFRKAEAYLKTTPPGQVHLVIVGRKAHDYFKRRNYPIDLSVTDLSGNLNLGRIQEITRALTADFLDGRYDQVLLLYTNFLSAVRYQPLVTQFLPIEYKQDEESGKKEHKTETQYIFEPNPEEIFAQLLPRYLNTKIHISLAESFTSEHSARMIAMQNATEAATDMIDSLTLIGNKLRQAQITKEIAEIVGGAEALVT